METERRMKLFVGRETSGDPQKWDDTTHISLALAETEEEARRLLEDSLVFEVRMDKPCVLAM